MYFLNNMILNLFSSGSLYFTFWLLLIWILLLSPSPLNISFDQNWLSISICEDVQSEICLYPSCRNMYYSYQYYFDQLMILMYYFLSNFNRVTLSVLFEVISPSFNIILCFSPVVTPVVTASWYKPAGSWIKSGQY